MHGSTPRVAYQGVPGAYSEAAAGKAYFNCEAIPCDQFEVAFQAVELWIADRAVLPVEIYLKQPRAPKGPSELQA
ncbi:uncharacterized protein A4U43_C02F19750 [Asparagus officinalis]|uniref:Prephenate dehydratase domain-containing protein n=1 Tax=Asparagus officinalis TaxID=4686 RepID=A0A5P1FJN6_ASPOF|nr:uncharacterized protein A4U43_C02F19750 [Asparagus officinalis]